MINSLDLPSLLPEFLPFWESVGRSRLSFPRCTECGEFHWYPMVRCPHCQSSAVEWSDVEPEGELYSYTKVCHPFGDKLKEKVPYFVALVTFAGAPGIRLVTNLVEVDEDKLRIGMPVKAVFSGADGENASIAFRPLVGS
ncbi:MAG: OB-fold domain-containing protein [Rhizobiaceae bacterium]|nr:OB-fold domain-containing protein [Rhizobiaceae bacterium]